VARRHRDLTAHVSEPSAPDDVDALFKLPLAEFTAARNALAAQLKKAGRDAEASAAKALAKPSAAAWAVNQLYWRHRKVFDRLLETGERLRRAHTAQLTGDGARDPVTARREVMAELARIAADLLRDGNHNATRDVMRRVSSTLEALSSYGSLPGAPAAGRLTDDLEPPGFEALAGLLPASEPRAGRGGQVPMRLPKAAEPAAKGTTRARPVSDLSERRRAEERKRSLAAAKTAVREAERASNAAVKQAERAAAKHEAAAARAAALEAERAEVEKQLAKAAREAEAAQARAREAALEADAAAQAAQSAERALESARERLRGWSAGED
jgi:chromosome segregation ATPase